MSESGNRTHNATDIQQSASRIDQAANTIRGLKSEIDGHRVTLATHWGGASADSFARVMTVYDEELNKVLGSLQTIHEKLVHAKITYESNEQQQQDAVSAVDQALNGAL